MIKAPIDLQDLRPRLYVKAKTETSWRLTAPRLRLAAVASPMAIPAVAGSGANMLSLINLEMKCAGTRSAGNPHAACDVAGAGNGITNIPRRARRGKPRIQTRDVLSGYRASSRPYPETGPRLCERVRVRRPKGCVLQDSLRLLCIYHAQNRIYLLQRNQCVRCDSIRHVNS